MKQTTGEFVDTRWPGN